MRNESGFTLIEITVSLVLVGMMAAIAGMGIVTGTKGYLLAKENSHMAQKAQLAMARIQRELMELTDIAATPSDPDYIIYDNTSGRHAIAMDNTDTTIKMYNLAPGAIILPPGGDILVDNVHNFTLDYFQGSNPWNFGSDINLLSAIEADLELGRSDGVGNTVTFTTTVNPRNTKNYGGAPPTAIPNTAHNYSCFVATAAEGDFHFSTVFLFGFLMVASVFISYFLRHSQPSSFPTSQPPSLPAILPLLRQNKGNVLIGLIVTMMIFAALGAGMVAMTGTSTSSQVTANTTSKAYYLAESGFRYAASQYLNAADIALPNNEIEDDRNRILIGLDGSEFTLSNTDERFSLEVYPYYFVTSSAHNVGDTALNTNFPGNIPDDFSMPLTSGRLRIGSGIYNYTNYDGAGTFTLPLPGLLEDISDNMNVLPVGIPSGPVNMTNDGNLTLADASFFPAITGKFMIDGIAYTYKTKDGNTLEHITDANDPANTFSTPVDTNTNVVLKPYLKIYSTGTVGQGDQAASRQIIYNVPIPDSPTEGEHVEFHDQFDDKSHWEASSTWGDHAVQTIGGDSALKVTGITSEGSIEKSLIGLNWQSTNANLRYAHSASGYFLSYDAQVKVGFDPSVPDDYAAGLSFRLDENINSYGVSFMRADDSGLGSAVDLNIVPKINVNEPLYYIPMIVLWQQTNSGEDRQWLAYTFGTNEFSDDMESPSPPPPFGWDAEGTWARVQPADPPQSGTWCWTDDLSGVPLPGTEESLITPSVDLSTAPSAVLTFWHKFNFNDAGDIGSVIVDGSTIESFSSSDPQDTWRREAMIIPVGNIQVEFRIETSGGSATCNWYIDDVTIHRGFPINESTLLVRIKEAYEVRFTSGGTTSIEDGDIVTQPNGAYGTVIGKPILSSGDWDSGNAVGIITLNKVSETNFQSGPALAVAGKGNNLATCQGYTARNNYIKVFYGDVNGSGMNNNPFDYIRRDNMRNEVHWPPDEIQDWSAERDYFTLVQWDGVNAVDLVESVDEPGVIVLGTASALFTPVSGLPITRPELGLHTFGSVFNNAYFDDFGLLVEIAPGSGFLTPIQE